MGVLLQDGSDHIQGWPCCEVSYKVTLYSSQARNIVSQDRLPAPGSKGSDGRDCPLGGRDGRYLFPLASLILEFAKGRLQIPNNPSTPGSQGNVCGEKEILPTTLPLGVEALTMEYLHSVVR